MPNYRRARVAGASYFFTVALADRRTSLLTERIADLRRAYGETIRENPVVCDAMVVLPDHLHAVWTLPPGDAGFSERWRKIKHRFSRKVGRTAHPTLAGLASDHATLLNCLAGEEVMKPDLGRERGVASFHLRKISDTWLRCGKFSRFFAEA